MLTSEFWDKYMEFYDRHRRWTARDKFFEFISAVFYEDNRTTKNNSLERGKITNLFLKYSKDCGNRVRVLFAEKFVLKVFNPILFLRVGFFVGKNRLTGFLLL